MHEDRKEVGGTSSASLKRFSRVQEVGPMVHTIFVFLKVLLSCASLRSPQTASLRF